MTTADIEAFIGANYLAFLLLGSLLIMMYSYRNVTLPAGRAFVLIAASLFIMCTANSFESWSLLSPDRLNVRIISSVVHYIVQPFVIFLELQVLSSYKRPDRKPPLILLLPLVINTCIYLAAPFAGHLVFWYAADYTFQRGPLGISVYVVTFIYMLLLVYMSIKAFHQNEKTISKLLLFITGIAVLTGTLEAINLIPGYIDEAFVLGVLVFYMFLITLYEAEMKTELMASELKLLREQIKPHFVFNALHNIKSLIRKDPENAVLKLEDFSEYLRANLDNLNSESLISFEDELENVKAYVSLALADESKDVEIIYDIKERYFRVPPLTIEPLLENAIQHGVSNGGVIKLSTWNTDTDHVIEVSDTGRDTYEEGGQKEKGSTEVVSDGKEPENRKTGGTPYIGKAAHNGIGLENARARLSRLSGGTLTMKTGENGTTVEVHIPKQTDAHLSE